MRTLLKVLVIGFAAVILLLAAAAAIGDSNARSIAAGSASLVSDQLVLTRLLAAVEREQEVLNAAFYRLSRTPESVDRGRVLADLDNANRVIEGLIEQARGRSDQKIWDDLHRATIDFSQEARQLLSRKKLAEASSRDLFFRHEGVTAVIAHLVDLRYARALETQKSVDHQAKRLATESTLLVGGC